MAIKQRNEPPAWYPTPDASIVGRRIRVALKKRGWAVADLARRCGIRYGTAYGYVHGQRIPDVRNLIAIAHVLKMPSLDWLLVGCPRRQWRLIEYEETDA